MKKPWHGSKRSKFCHTLNLKSRLQLYGSDFRALYNRAPCKGHFAVVLTYH